MKKNKCIEIPGGVVVGASDTADDFTAEAARGAITHNDTPTRLSPGPDRTIQQMDRRHFFASSLTAAVGLGALGLRPANAETSRSATDNEAIQGPVTLYFEFRVAAPEHDAAMAALKDQAAAWRKAPGFLSLALKQMTGDSTMVKNYPEAYKGVLAMAYLDGLKNHTQPWFHSLFIRFASLAQLRAAKVEEQFDASILPFLHAVQKRETGFAKSPQPMGVYRGVYKTVAAGNRKGICTSEADILAFLRDPVEDPAADTTTVENHVMIGDAGHLGWEKIVVPLLTVAQQTFQPADDPNGVGEPGAKDNRSYRKALSTEILRNARADGDLRAYIMHGVWESYWDHENSHLDPRFVAAAGPVGAAVQVGPVEPFYLTNLLIKP